LWDWKGALIIVVIAMVINLLANPAFSLTPILVTRYFEGGAIELAWLQSAFGVGTVLGGIALGIWSGFKERVKTGLMALILSGISMLVIGLTPKDLLIVAISANFSFGLMNSIANAIFLAVLQTTVPSELQGRIFTLVSSATMSMSPLGLAIAGPVADVLGVLIWFLIAGSAIVVMGTAAFFMSSIVQIEKGLTN